MFTKHLCKCLFAIAASGTLLCMGCSQKPSTPDDALKHSFDNGDWNAVVSLCNQMLEQKPDNADVLLMRGRAHLGSGDLDAAVRDFSRRIELQPEDHEGYYHREIAYRELGRPDLAAADGERARRFDPYYKSAYAYDPSNFRSQVNIQPAAIPSSSDIDSDSERASYQETIEAEFEPDATSQVLASGEAIDGDEKVSEGDIGIPSAPQIVHENLIPKLANPVADAKASGDDAGELAELGNMQFPANPTKDDPAGQPLPDISGPATDTQDLPELSTALPKDPGGNVFIPGGAPGAMSTGLEKDSPITAPTKVGERALGDDGSRAIGLNAPQAIATGLNAPRDLNPGSSPGGLGTGGLNTNGFNAGGYNFNGLNAPGTATAPAINIGASGLPLPQRSTGLPVPSRNASTSFAPSPPPPTGLPNATTYRGIPVYGPNQQTVISNSLPGYAVPNSVSNPTTTPPPTISTNLSDAVLQNRLSKPTPIGTGPSSGLRSLQKQ